MDASARAAGTFNLADAGQRRLPARRYISPSTGPTGRTLTESERILREIFDCGLEDLAPSPVELLGFQEREIDSHTEEFLVVLKPEIMTRASASRGAVRDVIIKHFARWSIDVIGARVLPAEFLARKNLMAAHYPLLHDVSKRGAAALWPAARIALANWPTASPGSEVLGAYEVLARVGGLDATTLAGMHDAAVVEKMGTGVYAADLTVSGQSLRVLNAFHPAQLEHFYRPGGAIAALACRAAAPLPELRLRFIGATDPSLAAPGTLKRELFETRSELGLSDVNTALNCVHISPSPIEAMFSIARFVTRADRAVDPSETNFGRILKERGIQDQLDSLELAQATIDSRPAAPLIELSEDMATQDALRLVLNDASFIVGVS